MGLASQAPSTCSCPAATGGTACPALRPSRLGAPSTASWQQRLAPASGWLLRRGARRPGNQPAFAPNAFSGGASSIAPTPPASTHGQSRHAALCHPPPDRRLAAAAATVRSPRWGFLPATQPCRAVGSSAAADMGLSGAGPPPEASAASVAASSPPFPHAPQADDALTSGNGHPPSASPAAAAASAAAATAADDPGATGVDGLDDTRKFVFADEWGFSRVGGDLPEGTSPATFSDMFPPRLFAFDARRAAAAVALPLAAMAAGYAWLWYMHSICPAWQTAAAAFLIGTAYTGLFKVAHECARFAFLPQSPGLQDALGLLLMLPSLYPYTSWRLRYMHHLAHLNELWEDTFGWHPYTKLQLATEVLAEQRWLVRLRALALCTPLKLLGSIGHWLKCFDGLDLKRFHPETHGSVLAGWAGPVCFLGVAVPAIVATAGWSGFFVLYLLPWLVFHFWLSTLSLVQHTAPHIPWRAEGEGYDPGRAAVCGSVTLRLPRPLELLLNDANYSLPQLLAPGLPVWRAREAYEYARERLLPYITEAPFSIKLLTNHITKWQVYDEAKQTYEPLEEVLRSVESDIETVMQEAEKWQAENPAEAAAAVAALAAGAEPEEAAAAAAAVTAGGAA
ncbi:hypothetical protein PLESTB_001087900 [Pleodorina starrii]|uniref:Fatty acid desaturase domain-containing protein n=1 Tax=Pleodorina starrii TaxID=330485 RepID=A0A9W6BQA7_9CHLO|nr:hypothetical protein PLESTM_000698400 [Pleodorina starrii]GLC56282.1 hypothetical protein PLESTB_001087900 [Pleodorina starrii]GLC69626.1 hypothetical protein PLESTF_000856300 [Pleodorina starrii]